MNNRCEKIKMFNDEKRCECLDAIKKTEEEREELLAEYNKLKNRIRNLLDVANTCLRYYSTMKVPKDFEISSFNQCNFGFVNTYKYTYSGIASILQYEYIGIYIGSACKKYVLYINDNVMFSKRNEDGLIIESKNEHIKAFLNGFKKFESMFYKKVDKLIDTKKEKEEED